jgi:hypothetical protein
MKGPLCFQHGPTIGTPPLVRADAQGQHIDAGSTQGARIMICGHRWTSHKAKAPLARWCDDAGISRLRHSDYGRVIEPDLRLALAKPRFRWLRST